jgi:hypothetical protein
MKKQKIKNLKGVSEQDKLLLLAAILAETEDDEDEDDFIALASALAVFDDEV